MAREQRDGSRAHRKHIGDLVPRARECVEARERVTTLLACQQTLARATFYGADNLDAGPGPRHDRRIAVDPRQNFFRRRLRNDQRNKGRGVPISHRRSERSSSRAVLRLTGSSSGLALRAAATFPEPALKMPALIRRRRRWSSWPDDAGPGFVKRATGTPRSSTWISPPRRTSRRNLERWAFSSETDTVFIMTNIVMNADRS